jgi:class 3 adenylate cyclase/tetratricopeptide (TPR) repeat protein
LVLEWLAQQPGQLHRRIEATLVYGDLSGFTALTERLAARGRAGAEEINGIVGSTFSELARIAGAYGADLLKWGGDAAVLLFHGPGSAARGSRAAWLMAAAMRRLGRLRSSAGRVDLQVSVGVHTGAFELFLVGRSFRQLVVAGTGATATVAMQSAASVGEVVVSRGTASLLDGDVLGESVGEGILLRAEPRAEEAPGPALSADHARHAPLFLPERMRDYLLSGDEQAEHRPVAIGFVEISGLDALIGTRGAQAALEVLEPLVVAAQEATERYEVTFYDVDLASQGFKIMLLAGVPTLAGNDADRLLRTTLEIVRPLARLPAPPSGRRNVPGTGLVLRAGVNVGKTFVFSALPIGLRRVYSISGDAVNLAARVASAARPGQVLCTEATQLALRSMFMLQAQAPFTAKGKSEPVITYSVREESGGLAHSHAGRPPFVGRAEQLALLLAAAAEVESGGRGKVVEVVGPAGIGKSRLIDEAVQAWPLTTSRVACDAFGGGRPYRPLRAMARQVVGLGDDAPPSKAGPRLMAALRRSAPALLPWAPLLADLFDAAVAPTREVDDLEPRFRRVRLENAFVDLVAALASGPAAFVFEDAPALDQASASLVQRLAEEAAVRPWLVVLTRRSEEGGGAAGAGRAGLVADEAPNVVMELAPLDRASSERLVAELAAEASGPRERELLADRGAGNPLFLLELARAVQATGSPEALPDALEPLLATRIDRLSPHDRRVLRAAAVLGIRFDEELLAEVMADAAVVDEELWRRLADFVREETGERVFAHALVRDAAYEGLAFRRRRDLHARAARAIERRAETPGSAVELLSLHWLAAEVWDRAWECACLAGERARALYANADAATHFRRALDAARHLRQLPRSDVARVGELLGDVCELSGAYARARSAYDEACRRSPVGATRARVLRKVGVLHERHGRYASALRCYTTALTRLGSENNEDNSVDIERCELDIARAGVLHRQWRLRASAAAALVAGEFAARAGYSRGVAHSLYLRHINSVYLNEADDDLAYQALEIFVQLGDLIRQGNVLNNLGISAYYRGDWDEALRQYRASRDVRERTGDLVGAATEENNIGEILSDQGHYVEARRCFEAAHSTWRAARYPVGEALATSNLGLLAARTGRTSEGAELLGQARSTFEAIRSSRYVAEADVRLLECHLLAGELERVAATGAELAAQFVGRAGYERLLANALMVQGIAATRLGDYSGAWAVLDESVSRLRGMGELFELAKALEARAELGRACGRDAAAGQAGGDAVEAEHLFARLGLSRATRTKVQPLGSFHESRQQRRGS